MIERLLTAERAVTEGDLVLAERLFRQVADADPRNAMAIVGLARVAHARGDAGEAARFVELALEIDPDEAAAARLRTVLATPATPAAPDAAGPIAPAPAPTADVADERRIPTRRGGLVGLLRRLLRLDR